MGLHASEFTNLTDFEEFEELEEFEAELDAPEELTVEAAPVAINSERRQALTDLASQLLELREMLKTKKVEETNSFQRKY